MLCSQCGFENPGSTRFCGGCGSRFELVCPRCDFVNPPDFSFCGGCGQNLGPPTKPSVPGEDLIERHLPSVLRERGLSQRRKIEGDRRQVTVLFCDMAGFTGMAERIGPEAAYTMMETIYEILMLKVYEFEGTVNELTGDGIMALFGAPVALEDAPQRAIRSALAIHLELARFNEEAGRDRRDLPPVRMRIGINTGPVVVGTLGNDLRVEFKAVGDTVNLASRLEGMAEPGTTLVTHETFRLTEGLFRFEALGEQSVEGKQQPVRMYRVIAPSASRTRFDVSAERGLNPFVGRERELEILIDSYQRAKEGRGQAVSITAEAGLGKSRLLYEFRKATSSEVASFVEGRCLSYSRNLTYFPLIDLLRSSFDLDEADSESTLEDKLGPALQRLGVDESTSLPRLVELLAGARKRPEGVAYTPEARKAQLTNALTEILVATSEQQPLIIAIEDLHWIDRNSEELLSHLLNSIAGSRILMLLTYRPDYPPPWGARTYHNQLTLNRLSNRETLTMARHQLGGHGMDEALEELVLEKTEGVPFFVEEFLRSLGDLDVLEMSDSTYGLIEGFDDVSVPVTIQDVLRSRVDLLPDTAKELLKTASVLGREMSHELLRNLVGATTEVLLADLSILKDAELLYERGVYPHSTYLFRHALTQEVVHDSLLGRKRRELHRRAGEAIESTYATNLAGHYGALAEHFIEGEDYERAAEYARLAARRAHHSGAYQTAVEYADKSVQCLSRLPQDEPTLRKLIDIRTTLAGYVLILGRPHEAAEAVAPIVDAAVALDDQENLPAIYTSVGLHELFATEDHASAMQHLEEVSAAPIDRATAFHWFAGYYLGAFCAWNCEFEESIHHLERARAMSAAAGRVEGVAVAECTLGLSYIYQGRLKAAAEAIDSALADAGVSYDPTAEALTQITAGALRCAQGFHSSARAHLLNGLRSTGETAQSFWRSMDLLFLGDMLVGLRRYGEARKRYEGSLAILERDGLVPSYQVVIKLKHAHACALDGDDTGVRFDHMSEWRQANRLRLFQGLTARLIAETLLVQEGADVDEARTWLETAVAADRSNELDLDLAHDHVCMAGFHGRDADRDRMLQSLTDARDLFAECGADGYVQEMDRRISSGLGSSA
jgi:class 3 adenylate cyclase/tetratricopeptide (TPR) repeat protein